MFPWFRTLPTGMAPIDLENAIIRGLKEQKSYEIGAKDLCYQFSGSSEIKEAQELAIQDKESEAIDVLGEYFKIRPYPRSITQHSDLEDISSLLCQKLSTNVKNSIVESAQQILQHNFKTSGHSIYHFTKEIDWFSDLEGHSWPHLHISEIERRQKEGEDLSLGPIGSLNNTWKLNRHDHFLTLGRAYWIKRDENYAAEFIIQMIKWHRDNPPLIGVNWYDPETVAIRAINWIISLGMFMESPQFQPNHMAIAVESLLNHGALLSYWLENDTYPRLSIVVALTMLADWLPEAKIARKWQVIANDTWVKAISSEFNDDNFHRSNSSSQQRLSCEWLLLAMLQHLASGQCISEDKKNTLSDVLDSLQCMQITPELTYEFGGYGRSDGFMGYMCTASMHTRNLLAIGAVLTKRGELYIGLPQEPEEMLWWLGERGWTDLKELGGDYSPDTSYLFSNTGFGMARSGWFTNDSNVIFRATPSSAMDMFSRERSSNPDLQFHNDALSVTLTINGVPLLLEPGLSFDLSRHDYRLSRLVSHTAPRLSNELEPPLTPQILRQAKQSGLELPPYIYCTRLVGNRPKNGEYVIFGARRYAYCPDGQRIIITRHAIFMIEHSTLIIRDLLESDSKTPYNGKVSYESNFLISPSVYLTSRGDMGYRILGNNISARIIPYLPKRSYHDKFNGNTQPFLGWFYNPNGKLAPANYVRYGHRNLDVPNKMYYLINWNNSEGDLPKPNDIDSLIGD